MLTKKFQPFYSGDAFSLVTYNLFNNYFLLLLQKNQTAISIILNSMFPHILYYITGFMQTRLFFRIQLNKYFQSSYFFLYLPTRKTFYFFLWRWSNPNNPQRKREAKNVSIVWTCKSMPNFMKQIELVNTMKHVYCPKFNQQQPDDITITRINQVMSDLRTEKSIQLLEHYKLNFLQCQHKK